MVRKVLGSATECLTSIVNVLLVVLLTGTIPLDMTQVSILGPVLDSSPIPEVTVVEPEARFILASKKCLFVAPIALNEPLIINGKSMAALPKAPDQSSYIPTPP